MHLYTRLTLMDNQRRHKKCKEDQGEYKRNAPRRGFCCARTCAVVRARSFGRLSRGRSFRERKRRSRRYKSKVSRKSRARTTHIHTLKFERQRKYERQKGVLSRFFVVVFFYTAFWTMARPEKIRVFGARRNKRNENVRGSERNRPAKGLCVFYVCSLFFSYRISACP